jgi:hypothetical protein
LRAEALELLEPLGEVLHLSPESGCDRSFVNPPCAWSGAVAGCGLG